MQGRQAFIRLTNAERKIRYMRNPTISTSKGDCSRPLRTFTPEPVMHHHTKDWLHHAEHEEQRGARVPTDECEREYHLLERLQEAGGYLNYGGECNPQWIVVLEVRAPQFAFNVRIYGGSLRSRVGVWIALYTYLPQSLDPAVAQLRRFVIDMLTRN